MDVYVKFQIETPNFSQIQYKLSHVRVRPNFSKKFIKLRQIQYNVTQILSKIRRNWVIFKSNLVQTQSKLRQF